MQWTHIGNSNYEAVTPDATAHVYAAPGGAWHARVSLRSGDIRYSAATVHVGLPTLQEAQIWSEAAVLQLRRVAGQLGEVKA